MGIEGEEKAQAGRQAGNSRRGGGLRGRRSARSRGGWQWAEAEAEAEAWMAGRVGTGWLAGTAEGREWFAKADRSGAGYRWN